MSTLHRHSTPDEDESGHIDGVPANWLSEVLDSETSSYEPDTARIRTALNERLDDATRNTSRRRGRGRGLGRTSILGLRLAGIPAGIAAAVLGATVAVAVTATVADHPRPQTPAQAGGRGPPAPRT